VRYASAVALGAVVAASVGAIVLAADRAIDSMSSPLEPTGHWRTALIAAGVVSFIAYATALVLLRRRRASLPAILVVAIVIQLIPLVGPVLLSRDVFAYWAYGRIAAIHDANPYREPPSRFPDDPGVRRMGSSWLETTTIYGPLWTLTAGGVAKTVETPSAASRAFRAISVASVLAILAFVTMLARNRPFAAAFVGWNPLLALHFAGGAHNDALMMALVLGALFLASRGRRRASGIAWVAATSVKWVAAGFAGLTLLGVHFRDRRLLSGMILGLGAIAVTSTVAFGTAWLQAGSGLSAQARRTGSIGLSAWLGDLGLSHRPALAVIGLLTLAAVCWLALEAWHGRVRLGLAGVLLAALQSWLNPWYALWGVSLAAPEEDTVAHVGAVLLTALLLRDALPL
jgi:hypothetical protein